jgi:hypothetical protein
MRSSQIVRKSALKTAVIRNTADSYKSMALGFATAGPQTEPAAETGQSERIFPRRQAPVRTIQCRLLDGFTDVFGFNAGGVGEVGNGAGRVISINYLARGKPVVFSGGVAVNRGKLAAMRGATW